MPRPLTSFTLLAAAATFVSAHQNFHQLWINGESPGFEVAIRMPPSNNPVVRPFPP